MKPKLRRIIAIIALVFVGLFSVTLIAYLADKTLFNGAIGYFALACGAVGLALFFVLKLSKDYSEEDSALKKLVDGDETDETADCDKTVETEAEDVQSEARESGE